MKVLAVLVLAVFTGCNANLFQADTPISQLEPALTQIRELINTPRAQEIINHLTTRYQSLIDVLSNLQNLLLQMKDQLPPGVQDMITNLVKEAEELKQRMELEITSFGDMLGPNAERMATQAIEKRDQIIQDFTNFLQSEDMRTVLVQMKMKAQEWVESFIVRLQQRFQEVKRNMLPFVQTIKDQITPYMEEYSEQFPRAGRDFLAQITALFEPYASRN